MSATEESSRPAALLEIVGNLACFDREHEKYYARAPLQQALGLQNTSGTLKALAERWRTAEPVESPTPSPFAGASDLNDDRAIEASGVLFMEDGRPPAEIARIRRELADLLAERHAIIAADLTAQGAVLVHHNERRWRIFSERVEQILRPGSRG